jgi:hypothetical protein
MLKAAAAEADRYTDEEDEGLQIIYHLAWRTDRGRPAVEPRPSYRSSADGCARPWACSTSSTIGGLLHARQLPPECAAPKMTIVVRTGRCA